MDQFEQFNAAKYHAEKVCKAIGALHFIVDKIIMGDKGNDAMDALYSAADVLSHTVDDLWLLFEKEETGSGGSVPGTLRAVRGDA